MMRDTRIPQWPATFHTFWKLREITGNHEFPAYLPVPMIRICP